MPSNHSVAYCLCQFWADCTTDTSGFSFRHGQALNAASVIRRFSHVSTAGGAFLESLEGKTLPGVKVLLLPESRSETRK